MAEFTPITLNTQEDVNRFMADRLERAKRTGAEEKAKEFAGFDEYKAKAEKYDADIESLNQTISQLQTEKTALEAKARKYESSSVKMRIAHETGLPYELAERLNGDDETAIRADAETLAKFTNRGGTVTAPMFKPNDDPSQGADAALRSLLAGMKNQ